MIGKLLARIGAASLALALALPATARKPTPTKAAPKAQKLKFETVETWGWRAQLPVGLEEVGKVRTDPRRPHIAKWFYRTDHNAIRVRVKIKPNKGKRKLQQLARLSYLKFVKRLPKARILRMRAFPAGGRQYFYVIALVNQVKQKKQHKYMLLRLMVRAKRGLRATVTLAVADTRMNDFLPIAEKLLDTFQLADVASVKTAVKKEGGKVETVNNVPPTPGAKPAAKKK
jgi:hypothetical protein